jgi:hypothetical protein
LKTAPRNSGVINVEEAILNFEGIQFESAQQARRIAAIAGGSAVMIGAKSYVVPNEEAARIRVAGVGIQVTLPVAVATPKRRAGDPGNRIPEGSLIAR